METALSSHGAGVQHFSSAHSQRRFCVSKLPVAQQSKFCRDQRLQRRNVMSRASSATTESQNASTTKLEFMGLHHTGFLCENLERSLEFYCGFLGLELNPDRPEKKLPYRGAWLWVGGGTMIHLMELPNPDPLDGRPEHGGRDRHACVTVKNVSHLREMLDAAGIPYTFSQSGRPAVFARDPDGNALEFAEPV